MRFLPLRIAKSHRPRKNETLLFPRPPPLLPTRRPLCNCWGGDVKPRPHTVGLDAGPWGPRTSTGTPVPLGSVQTRPGHGARVSMWILREQNSRVLLDKETESRLVSDSVRPAAGTEVGFRPSGGAPSPTVRPRGGASTLSPDAQPVLTAKGNGRRRAERTPGLVSSLSGSPSFPSRPPPPEAGAWPAVPSTVRGAGIGRAGPRPHSPTSSYSLYLRPLRHTPIVPSQDFEVADSSQETCPTPLTLPNTTPPSPGFGARQGAPSARAGWMRTESRHLGSAGSRGLWGLSCQWKRSGGWGGFVGFPRERKHTPSCCLPTLSDTAAGVAVQFIMFRWFALQEKSSHGDCEPRNTRTQPGSVWQLGTSASISASPSDSWGPTRAKWAG
ncbi:uncharacterized protein LOC122426746 isoform X1 [Cervus canadensis]|uniref:uncharacterized protein LOC122426746 isoform X1 n=2 Tax=Cervus canadensis TaxID=1574408 RepID=UPI001CA35CFE|nr:uncharacterized protein LOC122426746 isoform X1 [Cervus canadensis]